MEKRLDPKIKEANMPKPSTERQMPLQPLKDFGKNEDGKEILPRN